MTWIAATLAGGAVLGGTLFGSGGGQAAPDPWQTAMAQNMVNKDALTTAAQLNQVNQTGPLGSITYSGEVGSPDRTQTTTLSPEMQQLLLRQMGNTNYLADTAGQLMMNSPIKPFDPGVNPVGYMGASPSLQTSLPTSTNFTTNVNGGPIATGFDPGGMVQRNINTDFATLTKQAQDAEYAKGAQYLDPQFEQSDQALESRLAAQGITQGSPAYQQAMDNAARQKRAAYSDLRNQAITQGDALQNQLFGQSLGAGQFSNTALGQQYGMNQGLAAFQNAAQAQNFGQGVANAGLNNQAQNDTFQQNLAAGQFGNQALSQELQNALATQNFNQNLYQQKFGNEAAGQTQNINAVMALNNAQQMSPTLPGYQPIPTSTAAQAAPDLIGLAGGNYAAQQQANASNLGAIFGAVGKLGAGAISKWG